MKLSRRSFMLSTAGVAGAALIGAPMQSAFAAKKFRYKYANNLPPSHPMNKRAEEMAKNIEEETGGAFKLQVFPSSQLGSDTETLNQLRSGAVEFFTLSGLILSTLVPPAAISGIGFAFPDYDTVWKAMDGDLGAYIRREIEKHDLVVMEKIWDNGFREVTTSTKPIESPDDFKDLKIRVPVSPLWTSMFEALKSAPTSINFNEVYSALQTKVVDAQENPLAIIQTAKLYEVQQYCSLTNHMWDGFWFLGNKAAWDRLPKEIQAVVTKHINAAGMHERDDVHALNDELQKKLTSEGMKFNSPDTKPIRTVLKDAGFYAEWKKKFGDEGWGILEGAVGSLT
ncbi:TRAP transporter substrate-binding protein [Allopusillimonas soli]|uniref:TRAP transporter substrate-binding protein n=1 Tax=Allopusillimonas soli TaxID=659016 RepID=A0A853FAX3_9BURK|nr:TRAP transporter substrate-binding protein [Allopusillimonas soli]NYT37884.1 TRAP transporter substrate-binding protein [Allopusillimonas soli]TEA73787.1 TRAP transporter substrate-binding protein [Allopusillimonas soli]